MSIPWSEGKIRALRAALDQMEDAQATGPDEYVVDLYQREPPMTLELAFEAGRLLVLAAQTMAYDAQLDGWYLDRPVEDAVEVEEAWAALLPTSFLKRYQCPCFVWVQRMYLAILATQMSSSSVTGSPLSTS